MKIFFYKSLLIFFLILILFKLTVGSLISSYEKKVHSVFSKENLVNVENKLRDEIKSAITKERILSPDDAVLLRKFFNKLSVEINEGD